MRIAPCLLSVALTLPAALGAQSAGPSISLGRIESERACTVYQQSVGRTGVIATSRAIAAFSSWRTWLVRDCVDNFASMRRSLEAALGASGGVTVRPGARYVVSGRLSDIGEEGQSPDVGGPDGFSAANRAMSVNMDVTVKDTTGRVVFGALIHKRLDIQSDIDTAGFRSSSEQSGQGLYTTLQQQVALAAARTIAFHFTPLTVTAGNGRQIQLNYGAPLLALGTIVQATSPDGGTTIRYTVTSASAGRASARVDGGGNVAAIVPGSRAIVIEADDPAANGRRFEKVDLP